MAFRKPPYQRRGVREVGGMKDIFAVILGFGVVILVLYGIGIGAVKLIQMWRDLPPPPTEQWIGICIDSTLSQEDYQKQYERADVEKLKERCQFRGLSRDILGCYGNDHYKFLCPIN